MDEFVTDALVIDKDESGEYDARVFLYTEGLGGVAGRGTSMRKTTSKLSAHMEPLNFVRVRLIQKGDGAGYQIGDALTLDRCVAWRKDPAAAREALNIINVFKESGFKGDADPVLWQNLVQIFTNPPQEPFSAYRRRLLRVLGYDSDLARCDSCFSGSPEQFVFDDLSFYCSTCANRAQSFKLRYNL